MPQLDDICTNILKEIQLYFHVNFEMWDYDYCAFQVTARDEKNLPTECKIYYYDGFQAAEICHELLHAKCEHFFGSDKDLLLDGSFPPIMKIVMDFRFWQSFGNQVQHKIMYGEYLEKGYAPNDFFGHKAPINIKEVRNFAKNGLKDRKSNQYNPVSLKCYLNVLQHLLLYPCKNSYKRELAILKAMDNELYGIHQQLCDSINKVQLTEENSTKTHGAKLEYRAQMHAWFLNNSVKMPSPLELEQMKQLITD